MELFSNEKYLKLTLEQEEKLVFISALLPLNALLLQIRNRTFRFSPPKMCSTLAPT
jgi:hypothetical protein